MTNTTNCSTAPKNERLAPTRDPLCDEAVHLLLTLGGWPCPCCQSIAIAVLRGKLRGDLMRIALEEIARGGDRLKLQQIARKALADNQARALDFTGGSSGRAQGERTAGPTTSQEPKHG